VPVTLEIRLFGPYAEAAGRRVVCVEAEAGGPGPTAAWVLRAIGRAEPRLVPMMGVAMLAVNHRYARPEQTVSSSDELALIGLVSGG
jgi:molybdopterin converting factor small subunit